VRYITSKNIVNTLRILKKFNCLEKGERIEMEAVWVVKGIENVVKANPKKLEDLLRSLKKDKELFEEIVISAYVEGLISLSKASELLEITRDELIEILKKRGIPIRALSKEDVIAEVEAIKWF